MPANPLLNEGKFQQEAQSSGLGWAASGRTSGVGVEHQKGTMTVAGTATATGVLLALLLVSAYFGWQQVTPTHLVVNPITGAESWTGGSIPPWLFLGAIVGFVAVLVGSFVPKLARIMGPIYALGYGLVVGAISAFYENQFEGIVLQAIGATLGVFAVMYFLYATRIIKVTRRYVLIVIGAMFGLLAFYLVAFVASLFGADLYFMNQPTPLGIAISIGIAALAAASLAIDFAVIEEMSHGGAPRYMEWYGAMSLTVTLVWLYLQVLRVLALLRN